MSTVIHRLPRTSVLFCLMGVAATGLLTACSSPTVIATAPAPIGSPNPGLASAPLVLSTSPSASATSVAQDAVVSATFSAGMNAATLTGRSFTVVDSAGVAVLGTVRYAAASQTVTFTPALPLQRGMHYRAGLTGAVTNTVGTSLAAVEWVFTAAAGPTPVALGTAGHYAVLAQAAVSTTGTTHVTGDLGLSPAAGTYYTGFAQTMKAANSFATSAFVTGRLYAANMASPTPVILTTAVSDMRTAYTDAAGRVNPDATELGTGKIGGLTLKPGLYRWSSGVSANTDVTLAGGANDTWILQVSQTVNLASGVHVILQGGAQPKNVTWVVAGAVTLGTGSDLEGVVLGKTGIVLQTGAVLHGRALAQTAVTLDASTVTVP